MGLGGSSSSGVEGLIRVCFPRSGQMAHPLCSSKLRMDPTPAWPAFCEDPMACVPSLDPTLELSGNKTTRMPTSPLYRAESQECWCHHMPLRVTATPTCSRTPYHLLEGTVGLICVWVSPVKNRVTVCGGGFI